MTKYILLKPENVTPIDIDAVKKGWEEINNVPNSDWEKIQKDLAVINDDGFPYTLRTYKLNNLPHCVICVLMDFCINWE